MLPKCISRANARLPLGNGVLEGQTSHKPRNFVGDEIPEREALRAPGARRVARMQHVGQMEKR